MRIIHFTDFHLNGNDMERADLIVDKIISVFREINQKGNIDLIIYSGDLIDKGRDTFPDMQNGFNAFQDKVIDPILSALNLAPNRFIFTIGNHDIDLNARISQDKELPNSLEEEYKIDKYIRNHKKCSDLPHTEEYNKFRNKYWEKNKANAKVSMDSPFQYGVILEIDGKKVGINCLNTEWGLPAPDGGDKMVLGRSQIIDMQKFFKGCDIKFVNCHRNLSMLNEKEDTTIKGLIAKEYDALFCGHTHNVDRKFVTREEGGYLYVISPGTTSDNFCAGQNHLNGFTVIDYKQDERCAEIQNYIQNKDTVFKIDKNKGRDGVWRIPLHGLTRLKPIAKSLLIRETEKFFLDNEIIKEYIRKIKDENNRTIQIVGLSGLGKTRILQEAFAQKGSCANHYYCEFSNKKDWILDDFTNIVQEHKGEKGLVIFDNCPDELFGDIIRQRDMYAPGFRVIGVTNEYYDLKNMYGGNILRITLSQNDMKNTVDEYIKRHVRTNNAGDTSVCETIINFADGFPCLAIALVDAYMNGEKVGIHIIGYAIKRLLKYEDEYDGDQEKVFRALALFKPFPYQNNFNEAYRFIKNNKVITPIFNKDTEYLDYLFDHTISRHNGYLIDVDGSCLDVKPLPLAIWLVGEWVKDITANNVASLVDAIRDLEKTTYDVVKEGLCNRLRYMQDSELARELVRRLMAPDSGLFSSEKVICSDLGSRLFLAMSSVNPVAVASCLHNILMPKTIKWVKGTIRDDVRRNLVNALEKLCFDAESYDYGSKVMALLAVAENETWANNATGQFVQLFHIMLPGTQASLEERIKTLQYLREQGKPYRDLTLRCFDNAFAYGYFVRDGESAQFGLENKTDYQPQNNEIVNYWESCRDMLMELLGEDTSILEGVKEIVVRHVLNWDSIGMLERMFPLVEKVCDTDGGKWEELYTTLNNVEERYWAMRSDGFVTRLEALKEQIRPRTFNQRLIDARQAFYKRQSSSRDDSGEDLFRPLAKAFLDEKIYLSVEEVGEIAGSEQYHDIWFSPALAEIVSDSQLKELMGVFLSVIKQKGENNFRGGFVFRVCYQFRDKEIVRNFIRQIFDEGYYDLYVRLLSTCETESFVSYNQIKEHINKGELDTTYVGVYLQRASLFEWNQISSVIKMFRKDYISEVTKLGDFIISHRYDRGLRKDSEIKVIVKDVMLDYPLTDDRGNNNWEFTQLVKSILENDPDEKFAIGLNKKLIKFLGNGYAHGNFEGIYSELLTNYADAIWEDFEKAFVDDEYCLFRFNVKDELGSGLGFGEGTLFKNNGDKVKEMCEKHPDKAPRNISEMIPVFDSDETGIRFSDWFMLLLDNYADREGVLNGLDANMNTFSWTGSVIPLLNDKKTCLERIANHENPKVREWADSHLNDVNEQLEKELDEEAYSRFRYS